MANSYIGDDLFLFLVNGGIQGIAGHPYAHKKGKNIVCLSDLDADPQVQNNACLCRYPAVLVYRTFCYLDSALIPVYTKNVCSTLGSLQGLQTLGLRLDILTIDGVLWKWCGWYQKIGCQGVPSGVWQDPDFLGFSGTTVMKSLCSPRFFGDISYTHAVQQMLLTNYKCCTTLSGVNGCCTEVDTDAEDDLGLPRCICLWAIGRSLPNTAWGDWVFVRKIGCVGQNAYLKIKGGLDGKVWLNDCYSGGGYSITACGTCDDLGVSGYRIWPPSTKPPVMSCAYWGLYFASYILEGSDCGWSAWLKYPWPSQDSNGPDQKLVKGYDGWGPVSSVFATSKDGRQAGVDIFLCKKRRVWHWRVFLSALLCAAYDPADMKRLKSRKCSTCNLGELNDDHLLHFTHSDSLLEPGEDGAPCVRPMLPRSVFAQDTTCYDLWKYLLLVLGGGLGGLHYNPLTCIRTFRYAKDADNNKKRTKVLDSVTLWGLLGAYIDGYFVMDNINRVIHKKGLTLDDLGSWYYLRPVPCGLDPDLWDDDDGAEDLPPNKKLVDVCIRAFYVGVKCVKDLLTGLKKPVILSGLCGKWAKLGKYTLKQIKESAGNQSGVDLTKTNTWQKAPPGSQFLMIYVKTSRTKNLLCDKYPSPPNNVHWRAKVILLLYKCCLLDLCLLTGGKGHIVWPLLAFCVSDSTNFCSPLYPRLYGIYADRDLKLLLLFARAKLHSLWSFLVSLLPIVPIILVPGCTAYMCVGILAQSTPPSANAFCDSSYTKTDAIGLAASRLVFSGCDISYSIYKLWKASGDPCICFLKSDCNPWSPVNRIGSLTQISACSCNLSYAVEQIKQYIALYTLGLQGDDVLDNLYIMLLNKLAVNTIIPIKVKRYDISGGDASDFTYFWFYLSKNLIEKPSRYIGADGKPWLNYQLQLMWQGNPCFFATSLSNFPSILLPLGLYVGYINKYEPQCFIQSDSSDPGHPKGTRWVGTKLSLGFPKCKCGNFLWCSQDGLPVPGYYMDLDLSLACLSRLDNSGNLILAPRSDARLIYYFSIQKTLMSILGFNNLLSLDPDLCSCSTPATNLNIVKNMRILWGGPAAWNIQAELLCCPIYRYRYVKVYRAASIPGTPGDPKLGAHGFRLCVLLSSLSSGYMSFLGANFDIKGDRLWKKPDLGRLIIWGLPVCISLSDPAWGSDCASASLFVKFLISFTLRDTPSINIKALRSNPWDFFSGLSASPSAISRYRIVVTGHLSYIVGEGPYFLWDSGSAKLLCLLLGGILFLSTWDSSDCDPEGHLFTYHAQSCFLYTLIPDLQGYAKHISPRNMQFNPPITAPAIPLALWTAKRTYKKNSEGVYLTYSDSWCSVDDVLITCLSDCSWEGLPCLPVYTLNYTQPLSVALAPKLPYGLVCFNTGDNVPSFLLCNCWKCTRRYKVVLCVNQPGTHMLAYSDSWGVGLGGALGDGGWAVKLCGVLLLTYCHGATIPSGPPLSLPYCNCPVPADMLPGFLKRTKSLSWLYTTSSGLVALSDSDIFLFACQSLGEGLCLCSLDTVNCTASVPFEPGGVCTTDPAVDVKLPLALFTKLVTFYLQAIGGVCYSATDWTFNNLVCSRQSNLSLCTDPLTQTMYGYTKLPYSAAIVSSFNLISVAPRYWKHLFVYAGHDTNGNRSGTWSVHGPLCASDGTSGWSSLLCNTNYGQVFTQWSTDCTLQSGLPQTDLWPSDAYTRWLGTLNPTLVSVDYCSGWCFYTSNINWKSLGVCSSGATSVTCNGGSIQMVTYTKDVTNKPNTQVLMVSAESLGIYGLGVYNISYTINDQGVLSSSYTFTKGGIQCGSAPQTKWTSNGCTLFTCTKAQPLNGSCICFQGSPPSPSNTSVYAHITYSTAIAGGSCIDRAMTATNVLLVCSSAASSVRCVLGGILKLTYVWAQFGNAYPSVNSDMKLSEFDVTNAGMYAVWRYVKTYNPVSSYWLFVSATCGSGTAAWDNSSCSVSSHTFTCFTQNKTALTTAFCFTPPTGSPKLAGLTNFLPPTPQYKYIWTYSGYTQTLPKSRYGTWSSAGLVCSGSGSGNTDGWNTTSCSSNFGQQYTYISPDSSMPTSLPQTLTWPADPYIKWTASISPNGAHCIPPGQWSSLYVCSSGAASTTCNRERITVTVYTDITGSPSQESINTAVGSVGLRGLYVYTQEYKSTGIHASWNLLSIGCGINRSGWESLSCNLDSHVFYYTVDFVNSGGTMCLPSQPTQSPTEAGYTNLSPVLPKLVCAATYGLSGCQALLSSFTGGGSCVSRAYVYLKNSTTYTTCDSASSGWQQPYTCAATHVYNYIYTIGGSVEVSSSVMAAGNIVFSQGSTVCVQSQTWAYGSGLLRPSFVSSSWRTACQGTANTGTTYYTGLNGCYTSAVVVRLCTASVFNLASSCKCSEITSTYFKLQNSKCWAGPCPNVFSSSTSCSGRTPSGVNGLALCCILDTITLPCGGTYSITISYDGAVDVTVGGSKVLSTNNDTGVGTLSTTVQGKQGQTVKATIKDVANDGCGATLTVILTGASTAKSTPSAYSKALQALDLLDTPDIYLQAREQLNIEGD